MYGAEINEMVQILQIDNDDNPFDRNLFEHFCANVFDDGTINWGRVIALFSFGGATAVRCAIVNRQEIIGDIARIMTEIITNTLLHWIESQGGWVSYIV